MQLVTSEQQLCSLSVLQTQAAVAGLRAGAVLLLPEMTQERRGTNATAQGN